MPSISDNVIGVDFTAVYTAAQDASDITKRPFKTGQTVQGDDGNLYQYAKASAAIGSAVAVADITLSGDEYVAAATGGSSTNASGVALATGDHAWFIL